MRNVVIDSIEVVVGNTEIDNSVLVEKYKDIMPKEKAESVLRDLLGRNKRRVTDSETTLTLGAASIDKLLDKSNIKAKDIDGIIFASQFPEYTCPSQSSLIHNHIQGSSSCFTFDICVNCASGLYALSAARSLMLTDMNINNVVVIASDLMSKYYQTNCLVTEGCFGDCGVAVLLKTVESDKWFGLSNALYGTTDECINNVFYPECGNLNQHKYNGDATKISWSNPDYPAASKMMGDNIIKLLEKRGYSEKDLDNVCCSQFTKNVGITMCQSSGIDVSKLIYVGDIYGYTGVSSPLMAYYHGKELGIIESGNLVGLTTIGLGGQAISMIYKE